MSLRVSFRDRRLRLFLGLIVLVGAGVAVCAATLGWWSSDLHRARCDREFRSSDAELIERALTREAARVGIASDRSSVIRFIAAHPVCCSVLRPSETSSSAGVVTPETDSRVTVHLKFEIPADQRASYAFPYYHLRVAFDRCGRMEESYGEQIDSMN